MFHCMSLSAFLEEASCCSGCWVLMGFAWVSALFIDWFLQVRSMAACPALHLLRLQQMVAVLRRLCIISGIGRLHSQTSCAWLSSLDGPKFILLGQRFNERLADRFSQMSIPLLRRFQCGRAGAFEMLSESTLDTASLRSWQLAI